jgi:hypothetical protein
MMVHIHYIILENKLILSKKAYKNWREIQDEYYNFFTTSLGPWTKEDLLDYLENDYKSEDRWPFSRQQIEDFFSSDQMILEISY